jgi:hypothetical protein
MVSLPSAPPITRAPAGTISCVSRGIADPPAAGRIIVLFQYRGLDHRHRKYVTLRPEVQLIEPI